MNASPKTSPNDFAADLSKLADLIENDQRAAHIEAAREAVRAVARDVLIEAAGLVLDAVITSAAADSYARARACRLVAEGGVP